MISDWVLLLLRGVAAKRLGPTFTARYVFLFTQVVFDGYQYCSAGTNSIDFKAPENTVYLADRYGWMDNVCDFAYKSISDLTEFPYQPLEYKNDTPYFNSWKARATQYLTTRDADGWKNTGTISSPIPNDGKSIDVASNIFPTLVDNNSWTPLKIGIKTQTYLTPEWGQLSCVLSSSEVSGLYTQVDKYFPKTTLEFNTQNQAVYEQKLTDEQRIIAEFWSGMPGSITPPGHWVLFTYLLCKSHNLDLSREVNCYALIGMGVFQSSICAWYVKRQYLQARPIQVIRRLYDSSWLPYQENWFVTPPFPDFVSGHSTFSACCARILYCCFKNNRIDLRGDLFSSDLLRLINPVIFENTDDPKSSMVDIGVLPSSSAIQSGVPSTGTVLTLSTFDEMARQAGVSRIYGGIHIESSNQGGLCLGRNIANLLTSKFAYLFS
jgi:hypothetical protein